MAPQKGIAIVTGAGSGIGAATAIALAADGWHVVIAGRRRDPLDQLAHDHPELQLHAVPSDVTDEDSVRGLFRTTVDRHGRLDLLFNNAGMGGPKGEADTISLADWQACVAVNLTGFPLHPGGVRTDAAAGAGRRTDHQQWVDLSSRPQTAFDRVLGHQARNQWTDQGHGPRRSPIRHRVRPNRHRQCRHRDDRSDGHRRTASRRQRSSGAAYAAGRRGQSCGLYGRPTPDANVATMTVMATKMPYIGPG